MDPNKINRSTDGNGQNTHSVMISAGLLLSQYMSVTITCLDSVAVLMCHEKLLITGTIGSFAG